MPPLARLLHLTRFREQAALFSLNSAWNINGDVTDRAALP